MNTYWRRVQENVCVKCGNEKDIGLRTCTECADEDRVRSRAKYHKKEIK